MHLFAHPSIQQCFHCGVILTTDGDRDKAIAFIHLSPCCGYLVAFFLGHSRSGCALSVFEWRVHERRRKEMVFKGKIIVA